MFAVFLLKEKIHIAQIKKWTRFPSEKKEVRFRNLVFFGRLLRIKAVKRWRPLNYHVLIIKILCKFTCITNQIEGYADDEYLGCINILLGMKRAKRTKSSHSTAMFIGPLKMKSTNSKLLRRSSFTLPFTSGQFTQVSWELKLPVKTINATERKIYSNVHSQKQTVLSLVMIWLYGIKTAMDWISNQIVPTCTLKVHVFDLWLMWMNIWCPYAKRVRNV